MANLLVAHVLARGADETKKCPTIQHRLVVHDQQERPEPAYFTNNRWIPSV
ncbi:hypothetical protein H4Q26_007492 [Puccinia striiformis f. sp. tritici PST-130]|nr:hypothetical protein H4Q26_007492 [Puccinia striiformis f. sp. tritici PST-130]